jgi:bifunctional DNase/RNase
VALRTNAEIWVEQEVLEKSRASKGEGDQDPDRLRKWLEEVNPEELGKYKM